MLTPEDIQEVLDKFKKIEQLRASKSRSNGARGVSSFKYIKLIKSTITCIE